MDQYVISCSHKHTHTQAHSHPPCLPPQTPEVPDVLQAAEEPEQRGEEPSVAGGPPWQHLQRAAAAHEPAGRPAVSRQSSYVTHSFAWGKIPRRFFLLFWRTGWGQRGIPEAHLSSDWLTDKPVNLHHHLPPRAVSPSSADGGRTGFL